MQCGAVRCGVVRVASEYEADVAVLREKDVLWLEVTHHKPHEVDPLEPSQNLATVEPSLRFR